MKKVATGIVFMICAVFLLWFGISVVDVVLHNDFQHSGPELTWNLFSILF